MLPKFFHILLPSDMLLTLPGPFYININIIYFPNCTIISSRFDLKEHANMLWAPYGPYDRKESKGTVA